MKIEVLPNGHHVISADADRIELPRSGYEDVYYAIPIDNGSLYMLLNDTVLDSTEARATLKRMTDRLGGIEPAMGELQARVKEVPPGGKPGPQAGTPPPPPPPAPAEEPEEATIIVKPKAAPPPKPAEDIEESTIIVKPKAPPVPPATPPSKSPTPARVIPPIPPKPQAPPQGTPLKTPTPAKGVVPLQPRTPTPAKGVAPIQPKTPTPAKPAAPGPQAGGPPRTPTPAKGIPPIQPGTPTPAKGVPILPRTPTPVATPAAAAPAIKSFDVGGKPTLQVVRTGADQFVIAFGDLNASLTRAHYETLHDMCPTNTMSLFQALMTELLDSPAKATFRKMIALAGHSKPILDALNEKAQEISPDARIRTK